MPREQVAALAGRDDEDARVRVREVVDRPEAGGVDVAVGLRPVAGRLAAHQRVVAARGALADVHQELQHRHGAERLVQVHRLVRVAPAPALEPRAVGLLELDQRVVEREPRHLRTGLGGGRLLHVAPGAGAVDVAVDPLEEHRLRPRHRGRRAVRARPAPAAASAPASRRRRSAARGCARSSRRSRRRAARAPPAAGAPACPRPPARPSTRGRGRRGAAAPARLPRPCRSGSPRSCRGCGSGGRRAAWPARITR